MPEEINELDMKKYLVIKRDDIEKYLGKEFKLDLRQIEETIQLNREADIKPQNQYLVLNLDDNIDLRYLHSKIYDSILPRLIKGEKVYKIKDISVHIVNAIQKAKDTTN